MTGAQVVRLVAAREISERVRTRSFRVGTAVIALLAAGLVLLPEILPGADDPEWTVAVVGDAPPGLEPALAVASAPESAEITLRAVEEGATPDDLLAADDDVDAVLVGGTELVVDDEQDELAQVMSAAVAQAAFVDRLGRLGVDPVEANEALAAEPLQVRDVDGEDDSGAREAMAFFGVVGLFMAIASYGSWVLTSVLEEKANRVVELILTAVTPRQLLAGKVLGAGLVGLAQLTAVAVVALAVVAATGRLPDLPDDAWAMAGAVLLWFLLGFGFYAVGYAAAGSLVSRQEDAQSAVTPMVTIVLVAYFVSIVLVLPDPGGTTARIVSLIPPITPLAMPARIAAGEVATWEVGLAVALMVVATWLMVLLAARIYANALLRTGARAPLREALRGGGAEQADRPGDPAPEGL